MSPHDSGGCEKSGVADDVMRGCGNLLSSESTQRVKVVRSPCTRTHAGLNVP
jgi:hypothetical protein